MQGHRLLLQPQVDFPGRVRVRGQGNGEVACCHMSARHRVERQDDITTPHQCRTSRKRPPLRPEYYVVEAQEHFNS